MPKPYFNNKDKVKEILMVDHAGEYGAQSIYRGQLAFTKNKEDKNIIKHMLTQELEHLKYFTNEICAGKSKPTLLLPLWNKLGYLAGAISAIMGAKTSMLVTESIEEVIIDHYQEQIEYLSKNESHPELLAKIKQFRNEEAEHIQIAMDHNSKNAMFYNTISYMVKKICNIAIYLSKRI